MERNKKCNFIKFYITRCKMYKVNKTMRMGIFLKKTKHHEEHGSSKVFQLFCSARKNVQLRSCQQIEIQTSQKKSRSQKIKSRSGPRGKGKKKWFPWGSNQNPGKKRRPNQKTRSGVTAETTPYHFKFSQNKTLNSFKLLQTKISNCSQQTLSTNWGIHGRHPILNVE